MFDPRRHAVRPDLADSRLADLLPEDHAVVDGALEQVIAPVVPIFAQPDARAERTSEALLGERVMVFEDRDGFSWCQLQTDGTVGYIPTAALSPDIAEPTHQLGALRSFVYATPDLHGAVSAALSMGSEVRVEEQDGDFSRIGPDEWVFTGHLLAADAAAADPVTVAQMFLHTPYLWGGRSSLGLDCSALVQRALPPVAVICRATAICKPAMRSTGSMTALVTALARMGRRMLRRSGAATCCSGMAMSR